MGKTRLEKEILDLPPSDREHLAIAAWESLSKDTVFVADPEFDPEGIEIAVKRDEEIEAGKIKPLNYKEFKDITGGYIK